MRTGSFPGCASNTIAVSHLQKISIECALAHDGGFPSASRVSCATQRQRSITWRRPEPGVVFGYLDPRGARLGRDPCRARRGPRLRSGHESSIEYESTDGAVAQALTIRACYVRHGDGAAAVATGVPLPATAAVPGHASIATTAIDTNVIWAQARVGLPPGRGTPRAQASDARTGNTPPLPSTLPILLADILPVLPLATHADAGGSGHGHGDQGSRGGPPHWA